MLKTLQKFVAMQPAVIIPGHGNAELNLDFLRGNVDLFQAVMHQVKDDKAGGMTAEQTAEAIGKQAAELAAKIGIHDADTMEAFKAYFLNVFVRRTYQELDGPLGDFPKKL